MNSLQIELNGKKALVTGGSRGIGASVARQLALAGAEVIITYANSPEEAEQNVQKLQEAGSTKAMAIEADANDPSNVIAAVEQASNRLGGLDILVNNAGTHEMKKLPEMEMESFDRILNVNVRSIFAASQASVRKMPDGGRIINIGSVNADWIPIPGLSAYSMSKAAISALTRGWARDLGERRITVNCVQPGPIDTDMNPADGPLSNILTEATALGYYGNPKDIAKMVTFLASPAASYITGAVLDVDGGLGI